jgi:benzoate/toluate 1,2-dioxygenase reductase component
MTDSFPVSFTFADGVDFAIDADLQSNLLDAAIAAGVPILHQCRSGSCGTCLARLTRGCADMDMGGGNMLLAAEKAQGQRLLCQTNARSACAFQVDYDSAIGLERPKRAEVFINAIEWCAPDVVRLKLELADGADLNFKPGQFVQVQVPDVGVARSYSMATAPTALPDLELLIRVLPTGAMSDYLRNLAKVDDVLTIEGPFGSFFLAEKVRTPIIMIAGGTGLAPMMSMLDTIRLRTGRKPPILLSFGCATHEGLFHLDELDLRRLWLPTLTTRISIDRGEATEGFRIGNPVTAIEAQDIRDPETIAYLCGPPAMIAAAHAHLTTLGLAPHNIHAEQFVASGG